MSNRTKQSIENLAMKIAQWVGTPISILIHTVLFILIFVLRFVNVSIENIMLILTTIVSLEAIYLSLFIQMTVNQHSESLEDVGQDIDDIQENVEDITEDIDDVHEDVENLETNIKGIAGDLGPSEKKHKTKVHKLTSVESLYKIQKDMIGLSEDIKRMNEIINNERQKAKIK
jgi:hypothetical protein